MNITQTFYNNLATQYDKLFLDWQATTREQAEILDKIFESNGFDCTVNILDCACGIGTQSINPDDYKLFLENDYEFARRLE